MDLQLAALALFPALMTLAAGRDVADYVIPNRLVAAIALGFFPVAAGLGMDAQAMAWHASCGAAMLALGFAAFAMGWAGGGDAKLFAAAALWLGWEGVQDYCILAALIGGALSLAVLALRSTALSAAIAHSWLRRMRERKACVPYGVALAAAAVIVYAQSDWMKNYRLASFLSL